MSDRLGEAQEGITRHGRAVPRGQDPETENDPARSGFGRLFSPPEPCQVSDEAIDALTRWMGADDNPLRDNSSIPAGYTYLGQFIDHDISFDPTPLAQRAPKDPVVNLRTPRLDLDSLYGAGPKDQPFLYDWKESRLPGIRLLVGRNGFDAVEDLPRNQQGRALIGDARNDANAIVSQLHLLFIRFHNAVVDHLARQGTAKDELFKQAQQIVRWHYQWIVVHEFLQKVVGAEIADSVLSPGDARTHPTVHREFYLPTDAPFIPFEFSGATFRFGHSMVRPEYGIKRLPDDGEPVYPTAILPDLGGLTWLQEAQVIDWERFFELPWLPSTPRQVQYSMRIDTSIARPLFDVPDGVPELPRRNLTRGVELKLPSGQVVAGKMGQVALSDDQLQLDKLDPGVREELRATTPLWYYVLCEAPDGRRLGPIGGRIVAEVLVGLLADDRNSYLSKKPSWRPDLGSGGDFTMADLVRIAQTPPGQPLPGT